MQNFIKLARIYKIQERRDNVTTMNSKKYENENEKQKYIYDFFIYACIKKHKFSTNRYLHTCRKVL